MMDSVKCPYCAEEIQPGESVVSCPVSHTIHHSECWAAYDNHCSVFGCSGSGRLTPYPYGGQTASTTTISIPSSGQNRVLRGLGISAATLFGILVAVLTVSLLVWAIFPIDLNTTAAVPEREPTRTSPAPFAFESNENNSGSESEQIVEEPTATRPGLPDYYQCDDIEKVKLYIGAQAACGDTPVNVRSQPQVPDDSLSNIVYYLEPGETFTIVDGPRCAHYGTWWQIRLDSNVVGWVREYSNDYGRLIINLNP